jgi:hypothetical protein
MKYKGNIEDILIDYYFSGPYINQIKYDTIEKFVANPIFMKLKEDVKKSNKNTEDAFTENINKLKEDPDKNEFAIFANAKENKKDMIKLLGKSEEEIANQTET